MLGGLVTNLVLLQEVIVPPDATGVGSAQQGFGLFHVVAIVGLPIFFVSVIVIGAIFLMTNNTKTLSSIIKFGYGLGGLAIFNCIASLVICMLAF